MDISDAFAVTVEALPPAAFCRVTPAISCRATLPVFCRDEILSMPATDLAAGVARFVAVLFAADTESMTFEKYDPDFCWTWLDFAIACAFARSRVAAVLWWIN